jgi:hypothetical protein
MVDCKLEPSSVVVSGSPSLEGFFRRIAAQVQKAEGTDIYFVRNVGQCQGAEQVAGSQDLGPKIFDYLGDVKNKYGGQPCCRAPASARAVLSVSDYPTADCFDGKLPDNLREYAGPIVAYAMVVPTTSPEVAITMEEAYFVFGFGSDGYKGSGISPWTNQGRFAVPGLSFGAHVLWSKFLLFASPQKLRGVRVSGPEKVVPSLMGPMFTSPKDPKVVDEGAIGLTSTQAIDASPDRRSVRPLAIQGWKQRFAFFPDSSPSTFDKRNVRDGHYPWWAPAYVVLKWEAGKPANARAESLSRLVQGLGKLEGTNLTEAVVAAGLIPTCAMKVQRAKDQGIAGDLLPYTPPPGTACGCAMDDAISPGGSGCAACSATTPCPTGKMCSNGFCE